MTEQKLNLITCRCCDASLPPQHAGLCYKCAGARCRIGQTCRREDTQPPPVAQFMGFSDDVLPELPVLTRNVPVNEALVTAQATLCGARLTLTFDGFQPEEANGSFQLTKAQALALARGIAECADGLADEPTTEWVGVRR